MFLQVISFLMATKSARSTFRHYEIKLVMCRRMFFFFLIPLPITLLLDLMIKHCHPVKTDFISVLKKPQLKPLSWMTSIASQKNLRQCLANVALHCRADKSSGCLLQEPLSAIPPSLFLTIAFLPLTHKRRKKF